MWKSNVMKNIILSLLFVILICARCVSFAQQYDYRNLFSNLLVEAPDTLSIEYLKELPKFRCVHHDGFDRLDTIPIDSRTRQKNEKYSLADEKHIGKNSLQNEDFFAYSELSTRNATFDVGVFGDSVAFNSLNGDKHQRKIEYIDVGRKNYGFMAKRGGMVGFDAKVAFRIKNINNFYYVRLTEKDLSLYKMERGKKKCLWNKKINDYHTLYALMDADTLHFYADYQYQGRKLVDKYGGNDLCGLLFTGNEKSLVDDFEVNYLDDYKEVEVDKYIECGTIDRRIGGIGAEPGMLTISKKHINGSNYSLRTELNYYSNWETHKIANSRRTEISIGCKNSSSLDSWIYSFDVYFPGMNDGDEYYAKDSIDELFWQIHTPININMLSPNVALYLQNDAIRFQTLTRKILRNDRESFRSRTETLAKLVDDDASEPTLLRKLKRGEWHNFTIYVKEGYSDAQLPRSIVYLDGEKVIDWFTPNLQNCGKPAAYMKTGIYKWPWANSSIKSAVKQRVLYYDNIFYLR